MATIRVPGSLVDNDAITSDKIVDGSISAADLSEDIVFSAGSPSITSITYPANGTILDIAGGTIVLTGNNFAAGAYVIVGNDIVNIVTVTNATSLSFTAPANPSGSYVVFVVNEDGKAGISYPGLQYSETPSWSTTAGSLGSFYEYGTLSIDLSATSDSNLTFTQTSGTLPANTTLAANGTLYGVLGSIASSTTYNFDVTVTDEEDQSSSRSFSLAIDPDSVTWSDPANNTNYTLAAGAAIANVSLLANSVAGYTVAYTANVLPTGISLSGNIISGTPTTAGNTSTILTATATTSGRSATRNLTWAVANPLTVSGGVETTVGGYKYHTFTANGTFSISGGSLTADILVVGGGGGGADRHGAGGGGGGFVSANAAALAAGSYAITVGAGGLAGSYAEGGQVNVGSPAGAGSQGGNSAFSTLYVARGGGGGGTYGGQPTGTFSSGGGGGGNSRAGSAGTAGQGFSGGNGLNPAGGGGGGAAAAGSNASGSNGGAGGPGKQWLNGTYYAGGGGGGGGSVNLGGAGGVGGGGNGAFDAENIAPGTDGLGGGGGGTRSGTLANIGRRGGSGVVIIRYPV